MTPRRAALALASAAITVLCSCVVHRGPGWSRAPDNPPSTASTDAGYSLVAIGNPGVPGHRAARVADRLERVLKTERDAGRRPIVLWLGDLVLPERRTAHRCAELEGAWTRKGSRALHSVVSAHVQQGGQAFAVLGPTDRTCGHDQALRQADAKTGPHPWTMPDDHYVVRIATSGEASVASACDATGCRLAPDSGDIALELVVVDANAWIHPPPPGTPGRVRADQSVARLSALLETLGEREGGPPRVLVSSIPVEAAGVHGHGGRFMDATFHNLPPALKDALAAGRFAGSVGARDAAVYAAPDLTDAIKRSDRTWIRRPIFQMVSGSASWPDARPWAIGRRLRYFRGNAYRPRVYSDHLGFAVLRPTTTGAQAELWAFRFGRWETARVGVSLAPPLNPIESESPGMAPCRDCQQMEASQRQ